MADISGLMHSKAVNTAILLASSDSQRKTYTKAVVHAADKALELIRRDGDGDGGKRVQSDKIAGFALSANLGPSTQNHISNNTHGKNSQLIK